MQSSQTPFLFSGLFPFCSSMRLVGKNSEVVRESLCLKSTGDKGLVFWPKSAISRLRQRREYSKLGDYVFRGTGGIVFGVRHVVAFLSMY